MEEVQYVDYSSEDQLAYIMQVMAAHLSEPYPIYTYRYFVNNWPRLAILVHYKTG